ncbi:flagellar biosynthetic protein FliQ [Burkholderia ubonensis]|uniref:Flagellar biosynthetic protein FliQ n=1 Tax=Burkholderia ubonensis TaxID=101571 RepID=A0ABD6Q7N2_9BURK|nr:flagellar biosynthetic protein FliQ [Burkholderia ubonensis]KVO18862.1 flagellar biosynthetic protein FliQ [Burkholderia ubonensis]KVO19567.1 flagellar biosynthetic protein FliQ [Burkholderia ubonensis]KVO33828.1 flagellar biosynthetic protein FliQ [Burkholderia ubonensis]KVP19067.1 flagellar biosynthetic protein FliQ [Burkholderia ubonensis]KVP56736.1 flagellar biosynthetic protein FliQ [Burkholderia ubonensis]
MSESQALQMLAQLVWNSFLIAGPVLAATLIAGLLVSIFQVVTQLQEMSLSYVPKLVVAGIVIVTLAPWMLGRLTGFTTTLFAGIADLR